MAKLKSETVPADGVAAALEARREAATAEAWRVYKHCVRVVASGQELTKEEIDLLDRAMKEISKTVANLTEEKDALISLRREIGLAYCTPDMEAAEAAELKDSNEREEKYKAAARAELDVRRQIINNGSERAYALHRAEEIKRKYPYLADLI